MNNQVNNEQHWKSLVLLLKNIAKRKGISYSVISENTGLLPASISRIFSLKFAPSLKNFISLAQAIEVNFFFEDKDSDSDLSVDFEKAMTELGRREDNNRMN